LSQKIERGSWGVEDIKIAMESVLAIEIKLKKAALFFYLPKNLLKDRISKIKKGRGTRSETPGKF
jgi:hypothetical protein